MRDQVLLLVQFDDELRKQRKKEGQDVNEEKSDAITLLVDNIHSIPVRCCVIFFQIAVSLTWFWQIGRVVQQLENSPYYLFLYLDALVGQDPLLVSNFADLQVVLSCIFYVLYVTFGR